MTSRKVNGKRVHRRNQRGNHVDIVADLDIRTLRIADSLDDEAWPMFRGIINILILHN